MNANELFDLIEGLPAEALCGTIEYDPLLNGWYLSIGHNFADFKITVAHAEALQRDAMTEWLYAIGYQCWPEHWDHGTHKSWSINIDRRGGSYPTRTHALAAACRFVAGQAASSPSSS